MTKNGKPNEHTDKIANVAARKGRGDLVGELQWAGSDRGGPSIESEVDISASLPCGQNNLALPDRRSCSFSRTIIRVWMEPKPSATFFHDAGCCSPGSETLER